MAFDAGDFLGAWALAGFLVEVFFAAGLLERLSAGGCAISAALVLIGRPFRAVVCFCAFGGFFL